MQMSFFAELKRRNVFRVGIAYLIGAWLLMQIADVVLNNIAAPDWVFKAIMLVVGIGLPISLFFAWAFEMTPEGVKRESEVDRSQSITKTTGHKLDRTIIGILVLALGYFAWDKFSAPGEPEVSAEFTEQAIDKSIAVLPFVNMSADEDNEYFSDGLSEELLNLLAKVDGLKVAARTSSFKFKKSEADIAEIGEKLNVATILEGSVRKSGNQARITAQLIKVDDGFHLWSETYDRDLSNIFQVQDEIARAIVDALKLPLLGQGKTVIASTQAANFEAYDLYLLGRHHERERNAAGFEQAVDYFTRAVAIDPAYAPAWSGLADAYMLLSDYGSLPFNEATSLAEKAVDQALMLDPDLPEALNSKGMLFDYQGRDSQANSLFEQVLAIDPNNVVALTQLGSNITALDPDRVLAMAQKAWELDPLAEDTRVRLVARTANTGDFETAESLVREMLLDDPENPGLYETWAQAIHLPQGQTHLAIQKMIMTHRLRPGDVFPAWRIAGFYLQLDDLESAMNWLATARERGPGSRWTKATELMITAYKGEMETVVTTQGKLIDEGLSTSNTHHFLGWVLMQLGRKDEATRQFRLALNMLNPESIGLTSVGQAETTAQLINALPPGEERNSHLSLLNTYVQHALEVRPFDSDAYYQAAYLATFDDDRDAAMGALRDAFEKGGRSRWGVETNPIFQRWTNDPQFMELILEMKQEAARLRSLLEASDEVALKSAGGVNG
jgi:TolB-like protein/Tfp pilus assembly protein PilF